VTDAEIRATQINEKRRTSTRLERAFLDTIASGEEVHPVKTIAQLGMQDKARLRQVAMEG
jgi:hypothetical protein